MESQPNISHYTRRLTLPSGRRIEVVYYEAAPEELESLHHCGGCGSNLVQPVEWSEASRSFWTVTLRCPNCDWSGTGVYEQDVVDRFDEELARGAALLVAELTSISMEILAERLERFVAALHAGHIVPSDF